MESIRLRFKPVDSPARENDWNQFVDAHSLTTPYHTLAWRDTLIKTFGYRSAYLLGYLNSEVVAAIPGFRVAKPFVTNIVNPFCEYGFPLVSEELSLKILLDEMKGEIDRFEALLLKECGWTNHSGYNQSGYGGVQTGVLRRLSFEVSFEELYRHVFSSEARRKIRNADKTNLCLRESDSIESFYAVYYETMKRKGSPQFPISLYENADEAFGDDFVIRTVVDGSDVVAAMTELHTGDHCALWTAGSYDSQRRTHANVLLYQNAIKEAIDSGRSVIDFGRSEPNSGVDRFKEIFGGTPYPLVTFGYPPTRTGRGDVSGYKQLEPLASKASFVTTHETIGPKLKRFIHE